MLACGYEPEITRIASPVDGHTVIDIEDIAEAPKRLVETVDPSGTKAWLDTRFNCLCKIEDGRCKPYLYAQPVYPGVQMFKDSECSNKGYVNGNSHGPVYNYKDVQFCGKTNEGQYYVWTSYIELYRSNPPYSTSCYKDNPAKLMATDEREMAEDEMAKENT